MDRKTHTIDATEISLGRLASRIATLLMGKNKAGYVPHIDAGDFVTVKNLELTKLSGLKLEQKNYYHHTGYIGNYKEIPLKRMWEQKPQLVLQKAVYRMLPNNKLRDRMIKRLSVQL
jgi:large subunit ribosomal protein L13